MTLTAKELTIRGLHARGFTVDGSARCRSKLVFRRAGDDRAYLLGNSGGLRVMAAGETIASSLSLTGKKSHLAFQEVGARAAERSAGLTVAEADDIFRQALGVKPMRAVVSPTVFDADTELPADVAGPVQC